MLDQKEVEYTVKPSPKREPLSEIELADLENKPSVDEVVEKLKNQEKPSPGTESSASESPSEAPKQLAPLAEEGSEDIPF